MSRLRPRGRLVFSALVFVTLAPIPAGAVRPQNGESRPLPTPQEAQLYSDVPTLMDWTPEQVRSCPELRRLQPAESQQGLPELLGGVGERVAAFFGDFPNVACTEEIVSGPCSIARKTCGTTFESKFQYLLVGHYVEGQRVMTEYRADKKGRPIDRVEVGGGRGYYAPMLTSGFAAAPLLHFHPQNAVASRFRYFGRQRVDGKETDVVGFAEIPQEYCCATKLGVEHHEVKVFVQGLAWIDAATRQILRIHTFLLAPRPDVGLEGQTTQIEYSAVRFPETPAAFWLPTKAVVDIFLHSGLHRAHFRNIHRYSHFKLFRVSTQISPLVEK